jgi:hypothetical protein
VVDLPSEFFHLLTLEVVGEQKCLVDQFNCGLCILVNFYCNFDSISHFPAPLPFFLYLWFITLYVSVGIKTCSELYKDGSKVMIYIAAVPYSSSLLERSNTELFVPKMFFNFIT